jgi:hypothetical protein
MDHVANRNNHYTYGRHARSVHQGATMTDNQSPEMIFDAAQVAKDIHAGHVVRLGDNITLHKSGTSLVQQCRRCVVEARLPYTSMGITLELEQLAQFIFKHQHKEPAS